MAPFHALLAVAVAFLLRNAGGAVATVLRCTAFGLEATSRRKACCAHCHHLSHRVAGDRLNVVVDEGPRDVNPVHAGRDPAQV